MENHKMTLKVLLTIAKMLMFIITKTKNVAEMEVKYFERELELMEKEMKKVK